jgi:hypothetical protein
MGTLCLQKGGVDAFVTPEHAGCESGLDCIQHLSPENLVPFLEDHIEGNLPNFWKVFLSVLFPPSLNTHRWIACFLIRWAPDHKLGSKLSDKLNHAWLLPKQSHTLTQTFHTTPRAHLLFTVNFGDYFVRIARSSFQGASLQKVFTA